MGPLGSEALGVVPLGGTTDTSSVIVVSDSVAITDAVDAEADDEGLSNDSVAADDTFSAVLAIAATVAELATVTDSFSAISGPTSSIADIVNVRDSFKAVQTVAQQILGNVPRIYARYTDAAGNKKWTVVEVGLDGSRDMINLVWLIQVCLLMLGESPFYAQYGIPAKQAVLQQIPPDFYVARIQQQFAPYFAALIIARVQGTENPTYTVNVTLHNGQTYTISVPPYQLDQHPGWV